ncbi:translation initiation factor eIF-1A, partial [Ostertagia ostertagi]
MPKNKGKGGKNRRRGKNENDFMKRELDTKDVGQEYGQVSKMLGNGRVLAFCFDGKQRVCHIRGKLRKKVWINTGDIILVGLRDYQDDKGDVILKYTPDEARRLKEKNELPEHAKINENDEQEEGEIEFRDLGAESGDDEGEEEDNNMPSSGSDESEEESEDEDEDGTESKLLMLV